MNFTRQAAILALILSLFSTIYTPEIPVEKKPGVYAQDPPPPPPPNGGDDDPPREPTDEWDETP